MNQTSQQEENTNQLSDKSIASIITQVSSSTQPIINSSSSSSSSAPAVPASIESPSDDLNQIHPQPNIITPVNPSILTPEPTQHTNNLNADQTLVNPNETTSDQKNSIPLDIPQPETELNDETCNPNTTLAAISSTQTPKLDLDRLKTKPTTINSITSPHVIVPSTNTAIESQSTSMSRTTNRETKTPARKKLFRFLLPCFHPTLDEHHSPKLNKPRVTSTHNNNNHKPQPGTSNNMVESTQRNQTIVSSSSLTSNSIVTNQPRRSPLEIAKQHLRKSNKSSISNNSSPSHQPGSRSTSNHKLLPTPVSDTVTPAGAAAATSVANAHGGAGVQVPIDETEGVLSGAVVPPGKDTMAIRKSVSALKLAAKSHQNLEINQFKSLESNNNNLQNDLLNSSSLDDSDEIDDDDDEDDNEEEDRIVAMGGMGIPIGHDGQPTPLLPPIDLLFRGRKCLVLDLDETLVHSSFKLIPKSDFVVPVEIENSIHNVHVIKRPGVDEFMKKMGEIFEIVIFTASLSKYADPVLDILDIHKVIKHRLFRESCFNHKGNYVKDLSQLGRPINETIIIDNSPASYVFHPNNAVPVSSWFNDPHDTELIDLATFLTDLSFVNDVREILNPRL